ncbi:MAG TPA: DUF4129 domain-containing protein [Pyrinomonadaceae bacterium]|nr:DUF4129 domain-containing protein [Pyrinomonadaceae bacterium]
MNRRARPHRRAPRAHNFAPLPLLLLLLLAALCCFAAPQRADAASLADYRSRVLKASEALEELHETFDETDDVTSPDFLALEKRIFQAMRDALPASEKIEGAGFASDIDNRWLHNELDIYAHIAAGERDKRDELLLRIEARLRALEARLAESANAAEGARDKEAEKGRLNSILQRPEYDEQAAGESALSSVLKQFSDWLRNLFPKSRPFSERTAGTFSRVARLFVFALAAAVVIYVLWKYGAQLLPRNRAAKKKKTREARVVLGERLAPDQTPADLIEQAEALARAGDLRGAIRKAYIAVLFELGERRILRLAAHKTNRDYLSALRRERAALYGDMQPLTHNYERHWYGFTPATAADWHDFRTRCREAIKVSS